MVCGGRNTLLQIFDRRSEFKTVKVAFIVDQDMWAFSGAPTKYERIIFTEGYSLENDIYHYSTLDKLLTKAEKKSFEVALSHLIRWFSYEVEVYYSGQSPQVKKHIREVLNLQLTNLSPIFVKKRGFVEPQKKTVNKIKNKYSLLLRGKNLFQVLIYYLSHRNRKSKYSYQNIIELSIKLEKNVGIERIIDQVCRKLRIPQ